jgi:hypothetical protein
MIGNGVGTLERTPKKFKHPFVQQGGFRATPTLGVMHLGSAGRTPVTLGIQTPGYPVQNNFPQARVIKIGVVESRGMQNAIERIERLCIWPNRNGPVTHLHNAAHDLLASHRVVSGWPREEKKFKDCFCMTRNVFPAWQAVNNINWARVANVYARLLEYPQSPQSRPTVVNANKYFSKQILV